MAGSPSSSPSSKCVAILLGTWNGGPYLLPQLQSFAAQTHANWRLYVSDDGSSDETLAVIARFAATVPQPVEVIAGPRRGFAANFLGLARNPAIQGDYFAFSDQDDIWHPDKLERAVAWMATAPDDEPALYFSRTALIEANGTPMGTSVLFTRPPSFQNALVQNIGGANTMLFNRATKRLLEEIDGDIASHDWAAYQLVTAVGGRTCYDPAPTLAYRQHTSNTLGSNRHLSAHMRRIRMLFAGQFATWTETNIAMLGQFRARMTEDSRKSLEFFAKARAGALPFRIYNLKRSGVYRQTLLGNLGLLTAAIFGRF
ncbi:glycosyltransferase family 2 protein [Bradyrhizobium sp. U87765 SZCCT0131]|uniref:glycosyltransferase family 2 protein n=1 Tax=unclassified Bradyrhizobium TaxID=2631580 RepID=UPI001BA78C9E|nr:MULTISPECIES: glycosyltransferase family 2 protein [unclassified Bradyrhizobium]MBR1219679.1 glycosyltransferase family 2 protein [Bradyrhizobium sp. U87765 SZCCT0131]MBR1262330.1 glycosyltransferase family 2 protein [Bradyrhizobium sp. U87765 SZCCT0134]MBR1308487.1 glycosyltransferase family 2 protein [Bradyrhizobium sp. U87765 SZCCT0110]MBR1318112.1 glycosyltransferase family 2 protein [Bradyrhizobium sp. U87765 SZCCT0109]MBR1351815.1 glycosyltransferase family 2 protein [Bradyrhizobium s